MGLEKSVQQRIDLVFSSSELGQDFVINMLGDMRPCSMIGISFEDWMSASIVKGIREETLNTLNYLLEKQDQKPLTLEQLGQVYYSLRGY